MSTRRRFSWPLIALAVTLTARALMPLGYMPGNLLAGEFAVLCPSTGYLELLPAPHHGGAAEHTHHSTDNEIIADADSSCPLGDALFAAALPTSVGHDIQQQPPASVRYAVTLLVPVRELLANRSPRGPPATA